ncbi:MAG: glycosyltransferase [Bryobacter sp.]|nr:glycosyltransferase [Bryobacter sp.]
MRAAFFTDSFHEINGVAHTSRNLDAFARRRSLPFLSVHAGPKTELLKTGHHWELNLARTWAGLPLDNGMSFDLLFARHWESCVKAVKEFQPDLIHVTGPSDVGILGVVLAHRMGVPLLASWHTNLHEYAGTRLESMLPFLPGGWKKSLGQQAEANSLYFLSRFYATAKLLLAPNEELRQLMETKTKRPCRLMYRGVDKKLFHPMRRTRKDNAVVLGFCGRLRPEKNVALLPKIEEMLRAEGCTNYRFLIVGDGSEREALAASMKNVEFTGVLRGEALAEAYANMDIFLFPSWTDTFGNVILEALASGVPCVVTSGGGPKFLVEDNQTGYITKNDAKFIAAAASLVRQPDALARLKKGALHTQLVQTWDDVFEELYRQYAECVQMAKRLPNGVYSPAR